MSRNDDDSFSKVGFSDVESAAGGKNDDHQEEPQNIPLKVEVMLPPHFSTGSQVKSSGVESLVSEASSFVPIRSFGKMKVLDNCSRDPKEDLPAAGAKIPAGAGPPKSLNESVQDAKIALEILNPKKNPTREKNNDEVSSVGWSVVSSASNPDADDTSVAAGSTISGFDLISLNGSSQKPARRTVAIARRNKVTIQAPPGKLGILLANKADSKGTIVSGVPSSSVLSEKISAGDRIVAIDGEDINLMTVSDITTTMACKSDFERTLAMLTTPKHLSMPSSTAPSSSQPPAPAPAPEKCKRCSFLNDRDDTICKGCSLALVANPTLTADEKLAQYLQKQEEAEAFRDVVYEEKKRNSMGQQPLLFRAQTLANDIHAVVNSCKQMTFKEQKQSKDSCGFEALPEASLAILASRFIDCMDTLAMSEVELCYCYTENCRYRMTQIRQDGFGPNAQFRANAAATFPACSAVRGMLPTIREGGEADHVPPNTIGWIAAICKSGPNRDVSIPVQGGKVWVYSEYSREASAESLPLVSFEANLVHEDIILQLWRGLEAACNDFFGNAHDHAVLQSPSSPSKRQKAEGCSEDASLARALQASLGDVFVESVVQESPLLSTSACVGGLGSGAQDVEGDSSTEDKSFLASFEPIIDDEDNVGRRDIDDCASDLDGMERVGVVADDERVRNLEAAAVSLLASLRTGGKA